MKINIQICAVLGMLRKNFALIFSSTASNSISEEIFVEGTNVLDVTSIDVEEKPWDKDEVTHITACFEVPQLEIRLRGELNGKEQGLINISFEDFELSYDNVMKPLTQVTLNLGGLYVEDLMYDKNDDCQYILMSSSRGRQGLTDRLRRSTRLCSSCPEESDLHSYRLISTSLPSVFQTSPKRLPTLVTSPFRPMLHTTTSQTVPDDEPSLEETVGSIDLDEHFKEDSLVRIKVITVAKESNHYGQVSGIL